MVALLIFMDTTIKNIIGWAAIIGILAGIYFVVVYANSYSQSVEFSSSRSFSVSGEGKVAAIPDIASFTFSVISEGKDIAGIQKDNTEKTNSIIAFIKSKGVEDKDIKTQNYNLEPRYQYYSCPTPLAKGTSPESFPIRPCPPAEIVGYTITQTVSVKIRNFSKIGDILSGVVQKGANQTSQLEFTIDDAAALQNKAKQEAIEKARRQAEAIAQAGGFKIGRLISVDESAVFPYPMAMSRGAAVYAEKSTVAPPVIEPGSQEIIATVTLRYEIR